RGTEQMTHERTPRLERFLEQAARRFSGALHPLEILQRVRTEALAAGNNGSAANMIRVAFHPSDYRRYEPTLPRLREEIEAMLDEEERRAGLRRREARLVGFESSAQASEGIPLVTATFADTRHRDARPAPGATRRLTRHADAALRLPDGSVVRITHTPFTVGRGASNDLVIPSLAVSRQHAEISRSAEGFVIRDVGSRNGVVVGGRRAESALLQPGDSVTLGDVVLVLEGIQ
ncbi:MAG: FhaA domain-containing protein, partial [Anaerolineales bacterium]